MKILSWNHGLWVWTKPGRSWEALTSTWPKTWVGQEKECDALKEQEFLELSLERYLWTLEATILQMFVVLFVARTFIIKLAFEALKPYQLKHHVIIHTKEKPYNCEICQCKFRLKYHIHRHERRKHWNEKRFLL